MEIKERKIQKRTFHIRDSEEEDDRAHASGIRGFEDIYIGICAICRRRCVVTFFSFVHGRRPTWLTRLLLAPLGTFCGRTYYV